MIDRQNKVRASRHCLWQVLPFNWKVSPGHAAIAQINHAHRVSLDPLPRPLTVAGVDIAYDRNSQTGFVAVVVMRLPKLKIIESKADKGRVTYPYRAGLLAFREGPLIGSVLKRITIRPDVILFDGAGIAHPRRFGLASHLGVLFDIPTVGCAKTSLIEKYAEPGPERGAFAPLMIDNDVLGAVLRTRPGVQPVFVSPGHRVDLTGAIEAVLTTTTYFRLPEPIRHAHRLANKMRSAAKQ